MNPTRRASSQSEGLSRTEQVALRSALWVSPAILPRQPKGKDGRIKMVKCQVKGSRLVKVASRQIFGV